MAAQDGRRRPLAKLTTHVLDTARGCPAEGVTVALYRLDGWVLMIGTGFDTNTSFHLAESRAESAGKESRLLGAPLMVDGHRRWVRYEDINYDSEDFSTIGEAFSRRHRQEIRSGKVGNADSLLFPQRLCVDFAVTWLEENRR